MTCNETVPQDIHFYVYILHLYALPIYRRSGARL